MRITKSDNKPIISTVEVLILMVFLFLIAVSPKLLASESSRTNISGLELTIDDIICRNNLKTDCAFIVKKYYQKIGELVKPGEIEDAKLRLGTLRQFRNIRIVLEKSGQRGHVIVVIIVEEADQVQYNIASSYYGQNSEAISSDAFSTRFGVTDFNFMGAGKQLDLTFSTALSDTETKQPISDINGDYSARSESSNDNHQISLSYYDPHLFDSKKYYFDARLGYSQSNSDFSARVDHPTAPYQSEGELNAKASWFNVGVGKRFASSFYLALDASYVTSDVEGRPKDSDTQVSFGYGWDSRDDFVFPTSGSTFSTFVSGLNDSDSKSLSVRYQDNISLSNNKVFSYSLSNYFSYQKEIGTNGVFNPYGQVILSDIDSTHSEYGNFSGWKYFVSAPLKDSSLSDLRFGAAYVYQTDKLLLQFSLDYQSDWGE